MIASRQRDKVEAAAAGARVKGDGVEESHIWAGRVTPTGSHRRRMVVE